MQRNAARGFIFPPQTSPVSEHVERLNDIPIPAPRFGGVISLKDFFFIARRNAPASVRHGNLDRVAYAA